MRFARTLIVLAPMIVPAMATCSGSGGPTTIEIPIDDVRIVAACGSVVVGSTCPFRAEGRTEEGQLVHDPVLVWSSQNPSVADVTDEGVVRGRTPGDTTIRVSNTTGTASDQRPVLVIPRSTK